MTATRTPSKAQSVLGPDGDPIDKRRVLRWEAGAFLVINLGAAILHFAYELSSFSEPVAAFGSVNESTFEHLKIYFWPALVYTLVQHAYTRGKVNNYWWGKSMAMLVAPTVLVFAFYFYLGIVLPITGKGFLAADIGTGMVGVLAGNVVAYRLLTSPEKGRSFRNVGIGIIAALTVIMAAAAWVHPEIFLFENFYGYEYTGEFGILDDYSEYLVFTAG